MSTTQKPEDKSLPQHIAVIMDGNRRWARSRGLPAAVGHTNGARRVRHIVQACADRGVPYLTLFAFSTENWRRPPTEVSGLMGLLALYLQTEVKDMNDIEFVSKVAKKLPSTVLADLFSIPEGDREVFFQSANIMTGFFGGASQYRNEDGIEVNSAALGLKTYFEKLIVIRKEKPGQDYVSILLRAQPMSGLTDEELISQLIMMLVAGQVTTTDQINNIMFFLASRPELQAELRNKPELIPNALEELKRVDPAVTFIFRIARAETKILNHPIKPGDVIFISTHCINRDLPESDRPHEVDLSRRSQHFAYGHGPHYCLGAKLGRLEIRLLFEEILRSVPPFRLDETKAASRDHYSLSFSGWEQLPLTTR